MVALLFGLAMFFLEWFGVIRFERFGHVPDEYVSRKNHWCSIWWLVFGILGGLLWYGERFCGVSLSPLQIVLLCILYLAVLSIPRWLITKHYQKK